MKKSILIVMLMGVVCLSGCVDGSPIPGANFFTKGNSETVTLEGKSSVKNAIELFRKVARANGGFISVQNDDSPLPFEQVF